ncbi:MAG: bifunctional diaminohydroxyphosphoribosylaminopyrimidine deaminase/5-amino-6-(5-phosphoribosylamino)uracil reductase RibD [Anaerolineae bacterium]|nr:bifunctional diaminohydroxyphosphoribosylaminopyrimidine deaminase/5-amino-6-(5-phosphoribosylamino)uracil reductase RibD [Gloeobacterales cyanobacterium ES-bin-313]
MEGDARWMARCLELARQGWGLTSPNPMVGSVVVREGKMVGEGFHPKAGEPHAEVFALRDAGELAAGGTLYVNLEPCNHHGRTPPCTEAIIAAGIQRVVVGMIDPNPRVAGSGIQRLRSASISVTTGVLQEECEVLNEAFAHFITTGKPFGILKYAMTLDGKIATWTGDSFWVSGEAARRLVHHWRAGYDAVIVGGNTVRKDDPQLTVRLVEGRNPLRVVLSRSLDLPLNAQIWDQSVAKTLVFSSHTANLAVRKHLEKCGVEVCALENLTPGAVSRALAERQCLSTFWESGGTLSWAAVHEKAIQKLLTFIAPSLVGGASAPTPLAGEGIAQMEKALQLAKVSIQSVDKDWLFCGYLKY